MKWSSEACVSFLNQKPEGILNFCYLVWWIVQSFIICEMKSQLPFLLHIISTASSAKESHRAADPSSFNNPQSKLRQRQNEQPTLFLTVTLKRKCAQKEEGVVVILRLSCPKWRLLAVRGVPSNPQLSN